MEKITSAYDAKRKLEDPERLEGLEDASWSTPSTCIGRIT